jgi:hypothetical protein
MISSEDLWKDRVTDGELTAGSLKNIPWPLFIHKPTRLEQEANAWGGFRGPHFRVT